MSQIKKENNVISIRDESGKWRVVGKMVNDNMIETHRDRARHLHIISNSYGFNLEVINSKQFEYVRLLERTDGVTNDYIIPVNELRLNPTYKAKDFETQVMLSLDFLEPFKTN